MKYPLFVSIEPNLFEEAAYPIEVAWSLPDGQIKTTLITPEPNWTEWSALNEDRYGVTRETLFAQGVSALEVIREFDCDSEEHSTAYFYDVEYETIWFDRLYATADLELPIETAGANELMAGDPEEVRLLVRDIAQDIGLDTDSPQGRVTALLHAYQRYTMDEE